ncbi:class A beta-lactamase [Streptomyces sp. NPDC050560]|uniref:class A beta-lactamase n=1 Tax=Streptomyces sp. NPDC050560 TaxID=3365630 RepID=UPI0037B7B53B
MHVPEARSSRRTALPPGRAALPSRRTALALGVGAALSGVLSGADSAHASAPGGAQVPAPGSAHVPAPGGGSLAARLRALEEENAARLGVYAVDTATGATVCHRADERFAICSVFKVPAVAAVLRDLDHDGTFLARRVHYDRRLVARSGYAPVTGLPENLANGMTVESLCAAAVGDSDNAAANLLLAELGGPSAVTRFCRSLGDRATRLDHEEPLDSPDPHRIMDATTPAAIGRDFARLVLGRALCPGDRTRLTGWMVANTTDGEMFRAGLPDDWTLADKTGSTTSYGVANDVGVVWPPDHPPLLLAILSHTLAPAGPTNTALVAETATLVANGLVSWRG